MSANNTTTEEAIVLWTCEPPSLYPLLCFFLAAECLIGLMSLFMNCAATITSYYAQPLTINHRQSLGAISLNYALISGVLLARASFLIFSVYSTCNTTINTLNCKLQEFPLVFVYIPSTVFDYSSRLTVSKKIQVCFKL
ncbi:hypothetical protein M3Y97_00902300 [Aphelenchoides bicaudatus]|nr:hypothetical protein M3Y97_00902300 [Aphelenchoides bicaudatus]